MKVRIATVTIWMEDGDPRCRPGLILNALPIVNANRSRVAAKDEPLVDEWIETVERYRQLYAPRSAEEEKAIRRLQDVLGSNRSDAFSLLKFPIDF
jgi:hypothetical protein